MVWVVHADVMTDLDIVVVDIVIEAAIEAAIEETAREIGIMEEAATDPETAIIAVIGVDQDQDLILAVAVKQYMLEGCVFSYFHGKSWSFFSHVYCWKTSS